MAHIQIPNDFGAELSPNIIFKTESDRAAILEIMAKEYDEVCKFNEAPARKALEFASELEKVLEQKPKPEIIHLSPHFELRETTEEEKAQLMQEHLAKIKDINEKSPMP